ncbi:hypothetical protein AB4090_01885 [Acidithiobacillus sp. IBUN Pt1247-S3]|uniref:hypothetical protein n=1 Tax=Acidithiobacillus sp. IBUN Pt1247-S3 TaxID=3166642 RepID=UPI0034E4CA18
MNISVELAQVAHVDALQNLITGGILIGLGLLLFLASWLLWRWRRRNPDAEEAIILVILGLSLAGILLLTSLLFLGNLWNWEGLVHPAIYAAHQQIETQNRPRPLL